MNEMIATGKDKAPRNTGRVAVVTVTYGDRAALLKRMLRGVRGQTAWERIVKMVVCCNGAGAETIAFLKSSFPGSGRIQTVILPENRGSAAGYAAALAAAAGCDCEHIWCLDDDNLPAPDALERLFEALAAPQEPVALFSLRNRRRNYARLAAGVSGREAFGSSSSFMRFSVFDIPAKILKRFERAPIPFPDGKRRKKRRLPIPYASYGGLFFRREFLPRVGFPDASLYLYEDDTEFTARFIKAGYPIYLVPGSVVEDIEVPWYSGKDTRWGRWRLALLSGEEEDLGRVYYSVRNRVIYETRHTRRRRHPAYYLNGLAYTTLLFLQAGIMKLRGDRFAWLSFEAVVAGALDGFRGRTGKKEALPRPRDRLFCENRMNSAAAGRVREISKVPAVAEQSRKGAITVMFFIPSLSGGGAERIVQILLHRLDRSRFSPSLVLLHPEIVYTLPPDVKPTVLGKKSRWDFFRMARALAGTIDRQRPDVLVSFLDYCNLLAITAGRLSRTRPRIVISARNNTSRRLTHSRLGALKKALAIFLYRYSDSVACISRGVRDDLKKNFRVPAEKMKIIYNGINIDEVKQLAAELPDHCYFNPKTRPVIVAAGRLVNQKDFSTLLRAFARVIDKVDCRLLILGEGPERENLRRLSRELGIADKVELPGFQPNPFSFFSRSDLFVLSSFWEGFGNVLIEAMACGTAVISTDCPFGPSEIIRNGKGGLLVPAGDEAALAAAILKVLTDKSLGEGLAAAGKKRADDFSAAKMVAEYQKLFEKLK